MEKAAKSANLLYIKVLVIILLMAGIGMLPPIGAITPYGMKILGIFVGCIAGWGLGLQFITSVSALIFLSFLEENTIDSVFGSAFGDSGMILVIFALLFCFGVEQTGIMTFVANYILSRKFASKGPWFVSLAFWIATAVCSALITNCIPVVILMWALFYDVVGKMGVPRTDKWVQITLIFICVMGYTGAPVMPYSGWPILAYGLAGRAIDGITVNFAAHVVFMVVINIAVIILFFVVCQFLLGRHVSGRVVENIIEDQDIKMTKRQKWGVFYLVLLGLAVFLPNIIDASVPGIGVLTHLSSTGCFAVICILMCITRVEGKPVLDPVAGMKNLPWTLYFLLLAAFVMASLISTPETGISETIVSILNVLLGNVGIVGVIAIFVAFGCITTNAINNMVCMNIFIPIGVAMIAGMGGNPVILIELLQIALYLGLLLPSGSAIGALMHGNTDWLQAKSIYKYASIGCLIVVIVCLVIGIPLGSVLF